MKRKRRFAPSFDSMEIRSTPSAGLLPMADMAPAMATQPDSGDSDASFAITMDDSSGYDSGYTVFTPYDGDCPGIDFGAPPSAVPIPILE